MPWLVWLMLMIGTFCLAGFAVRAHAQGGGGPVTAEQVTKASNAEIERMLRNVEARPAPPKKMGAMCYAPVRPRPVTEYICPTCGEKTLYAPGENPSWTPLNDLEPLRRGQVAAQEAAQERGASVALDERQYCRKCLPGFTNEPQAVLVVRLPDGCEQRTEKFTVRDLWILRDFFAGKAVLVGGNESESPLKEQLPRLRELLGMEQVEE